MFIFRVFNKIGIHMGIILLKKHYFCLDEQIRSLTRPKRLITTIKKTTLAL